MRRSPSLVRSRATLSLFALLLLPACTWTCSGGNTRFQPGYATYWVEFYDYVVDRFGVPQRALCTNPVTFAGDIDTICPPLPMVWSYGQYGRMGCVYTDAVGQPWRYTDIYYFTPGYIQEVPCQSGYDYPTSVDPTAVNAMSEVGRDGENRVLAPTDVMLASEDTPLGELRALIERRDLLPDGAPEEPTVVRITDTTLGVPDAGADGG